MSDRRSSEPPSPEDKTNVSGNPDQTIVRGPANKSATILREPAKDGSSEATIIRAPIPESSKKNAPDAVDDDARTVARGGDDSARTEIRDRNEAPTVVRGEGPQTSGSTADDNVPGDDVPGDNDATVIGGAPTGNDDSTVIAGGGGGSDDSTVISDNHDDDSTIIGGRATESDTTYIAAVGKQIESKGNSEAGRLLKNRFVLEEKVGSGGMGDVYKALDLRAQEAQERNPYIAIKLLNENFSRHKDAFVSLQREASKTRAIPHPNIMGVFDFDREGDTVFMSMELLSGKPLDDYLREHPEGVSIEDAWNIIDGISQGLIRAHGAGIVHSDFKPGNIFYTADKLAKVFDFGIARAVSAPGEMKADGDKTLFDAGSLGALTPTYASLEMLQGKSPTKSDDVYAVALVAYELFTGRHPYDRTPADKALERGMKPKPVSFLKRRQWRALRKALELEGEKRTQSVDEFHEMMFKEDPPYLLFAGVATVLLSSVGFGVYNFIYGGETEPQALTDFRAMHSGRLGQFDDLISKGNQQWTEQAWHDQISTNLNRYGLMTIQMKENPEWLPWIQESLSDYDDQLESKQQALIETYTNEIDSLLEESRARSSNIAEVSRALGIELDRADVPVVGDDNLPIGEETLDGPLIRAEFIMSQIEEKGFKAFDPEKVESLKTRLVERGLELRYAFEDYEEAVAERVAAQEEAARIAEEQRLVAEREQQKMQQYSQYADQLASLLREKKGADVADQDVRQLGQLVQNLKTTYPERFQHDYENITKYTRNWIMKSIGTTQPQRAREVKTMVASYFPNEELIEKITIIDRDFCDATNLVGKGILARRFCEDPLTIDGTGPELVVIPANMGLNERTESAGIKYEGPKFAVTKTEIMGADYNLYLQAMGKPLLEGEAISLPVTGISVEQARDYASWLGEQTGRSYRLPQWSEWQYAAWAGELNPDPNVNCTVDSRGVRLGDRMMSASSGAVNDWGLHHAVGNAREWVVNDLNDSADLVAAGGARTDPKAECSVATWVEHSGEADEVTGFRLLREIGGSSEGTSTNQDVASS